MSSSRSSGCVLATASPSHPSHHCLNPSRSGPHQANDNQLHAIPSLPESTHPALSTIYLEGNPLQKQLATAYRRKVMLELPQVTQIDANFVRRS